MKIIAGNFKSHLNRQATSEFCENLESKLDANADKKVYIFPATSSLLTNQYRHIRIGAQNCHHAESGAFTGEITLEHLKEFHIKTILIGHSERRNIFGESDEIIAEKFAFFEKRGFEIFYCIGEDLRTKESGKTQEFLQKQMSYINKNYEKLIIAYEPLWAIGTGINATIEQISEVYGFIKSCCAGFVIYGGSVNAENSKEILKVADGVLVGGASLKVESFYNIIKE